MPIPLNCACGRAMRIKDEVAGSRVKCPRCGAVLAVPKPPPPEEEEIPLLPLETSEPVTPSEGADNPRLAEQAQAATRQCWPARGEQEGEEEDEPERARRERRRREKEREQEQRERRDEERQQRRRERIERAEERQRERRKAGVVIGDRYTNAGVLGGLFMLLIAIAWFVGGLAAGYIFFYPPILAVLGIAAFIRGIVNR